MSHLLRISVRSPKAVEPEAMIEAVAMWVGASIPRNLVGSMAKTPAAFMLATEHAQFEIEWQDGENLVLHGQSLPNKAQQTFALCYVLIVGLRQAGFAVSYSGDWGEWMPPPEASQTASPQIIFRKVGAEHDAKASKKFRFSPTQLAGWYRHFNAIENLTQAGESKRFPGKLMDSEGCYVWMLPEGVMVKARVIDDQLIDHRVMGCSLPDQVLRKGLPLSTAQSRRTWGEAWLPHEIKEQILIGLVRLGHETAIVTDRIYRYRVEDKTSLSRRSWTFGQGSSTSFEFAEWIEFARHFHANKNFRASSLCLKQAEWLAHSEDLKTVLRERRTALRPPKRVRVLRSKAIRRLKLDQMGKWTGPETQAKVASVETQRQEAYLYSDFGRLPWDVPQTDSAPVEPLVAKNAGLTMEVLQRLVPCESFGFYRRRFWACSLLRLLDIAFGVDLFRVSTLSREFQTPSSSDERGNLPWDRRPKLRIEDASDDEAKTTFERDDRED